MKLLRFVVLLLMVIGSLNWGLIGFFGYNFIGDVVGGMTGMGGRVLFAIIGLAGLFGIGMLCRCCNSGGGCKCGPSCHCCHKKD